MEIWKYTIHPGLTSHTMPENAKWLFAREQEDQFCAWALVAPNAPPVTREIFTVGTGHPILTGMRLGEYLGSAYWHKGALIFHAFEVAQ